MSTYVSFHELAELELNDAADFYDSREAGLGLAFIHGVRQAAIQISEHPGSSRVVRGNVRRKVLTQFPYNTIYSLTPDTIRILAIASQRRRPFYWQGGE